MRELSDLVCNSDALYLDDRDVARCGVPGEIELRVQGGRCQWMLPRSLHQRGERILEPPVMPEATSVTVGIHLPEPRWDVDECILIRGPILESNRHSRVRVFALHDSPEVKPDYGPNVAAIRTRCLGVGEWLRRVEGELTNISDRAASALEQSKCLSVLDMITNRLIAEGELLVPALTTTRVAEGPILGPFVEVPVLVARLRIGEHEYVRRSCGR
jgi:hypothetical protein